MLTKLQEAALSLMAVIVARDEVYKTVNAQLRSLGQDFAPRINLMDDDLWQPITDLLDTATGDSLPSYFLYEARGMKDGGATIEADGTRWPIKTLDDVRAYLEHINSLQPSQ